MITHWWNLMSSSSTAFLVPEDRPLDSNSSLSLRPSFSSGMPDKNDCTACHTYQTRTRDEEVAEGSMQEKGLRKRDYEGESEKLF